MPRNQEKVSQLLADSHFAFINSQNSEALHTANEAIRLAPKNPDGFPEGATNKDMMITNGSHAGEILPKGTKVNTYRKE